MTASVQHSVSVLHNHFRSWSKKKAHMLPKILQDVFTVTNSWTGFCMVTSQPSVMQKKRKSWGLSWAASIPAWKVISVRGTNADAVSEQSRIPSHQCPLQSLGVRMFLAHGVPSTIQSGGAVGVRIQPGCPGSGTHCMCVKTTGSHKQQNSSAGANVAFTNTLPPFITKLNACQDQHNCWNEPRSERTSFQPHNISRIKVTPLDWVFNIQGNVQHLATSFEEACFRRCTEESGTVINGLNSLHEEM